VRKHTSPPSWDPDSPSIISLVRLTGIIVILAEMGMVKLGFSDEDEGVSPVTFMLMAAVSSALSCIVTTYMVLWVCVDSENQIREDCIDICPRWGEVRISGYTKLCTALLRSDDAVSGQS